jgi:hypothetical protein
MLRLRLRHTKSWGFLSKNSDCIIIILKEIRVYEKNGAAPALILSPILWFILNSADSGSGFATLLLNFNFI